MILKRIVWIISMLGVVHKLRWQVFGIFWPPIPLRLHFLPYKSWHFLTTYPPLLVNALFDYLPTSFCKRTLWTTPLVLLLKEIVPRATIMIWCFAVICRTFNTFFCTTILSYFLWVFFRVSGWQWYFVWKIVLTCCEKILL